MEVILAQHPPRAYTLQPPRVVLDFALVATLMLLYCGGYAFSVASPDTTRDVYIAYLISQGQSFPLEGPLLGGAIHASPVWYYLVALPLLVVKSWLAVALFVGCLASLKFLLAYVCGKLLVDREVGLYWVIALAIPGWGALQPISFFSPNLVETSVLLSVWLAIRMWRWPRLGVAFMGGAACTLGLNMHPTTLPAVLLPLLATCIRTRGSRRMMMAGAFLVFASLSFIPYLTSQVMRHFPDLHPGTAYVATSIDALRALHVPTVAWAVAIEGPLLVARYLGGADGFVVALLQFALVALWLAVLLGWACSALEGGRTATPTRGFAIAPTVALAYTWFVVALRPNTPAYFAYVLLPAFAAVLAIGLRGLGAAVRHSRCIATAALLVVLANVAIDAAIARDARNGVGTLPGLLDIATSGTSTPYSDIWFPAYAHAERGRHLCSLRAMAVLHGALAYVVDRNAGVDALLACGHMPNVEISGRRADGVQVIGLPRAYWTALHRDPACWIGPVGIAHANQVVAPEDAIPMADAQVYPPRGMLRGPQLGESFEFVTAPGEVVAITSIVLGPTVRQALSVRADGIELNPVAANEVLAAYRSNASDQARVHWRVAFASIHPGYVDVVTLPAPAGRVAAGSCNAIATASAGNSELPLQN